ncbi:MAG TPA: dihydrolipoyl dehydrogenase [Burkholderiaceae bacterium]|nr:dihydrolipoyl dehydrogenase [Burkholderiaceae bacterium]
MSQSFDVLVIGAGPAGYIAAIRAAQLGFRVACAEKWLDPNGEPALGGTCLNVGCIPSKALLASSEEFEKAGHHLAEHGIDIAGVKLDLAKMMARKQAIVSKMTKGIEYLFRKNKITWLRGHAKFVGNDGDRYQLEVSRDNQTELASAEHVIIATGSKARHLQGVPVDNETICDNEGALAFDSVPKRLAVIGAGVIGLELGSVWRRLGAQVTILESLPALLPACDDAIAREAAKLFARQGLAIELGVNVGEVSRAKKGVTIDYADAGGNAKKLEADRLIVSIGRTPNTDGLGLDAIGLRADDRGFIPVDEHCATAAPNVWAIGDVVRGPMLAHKGEDEGVMVAERIAGQHTHVDYDCMPWVIYTAPEIAWVGRTEKQLKADGRTVRAGQFPFSANGRALGIGSTEGFVKVIADANTDEVLGVHVIAASASDLIAEAVLAMEFKAASEDIARVSHPHPSLSEVMREAALAVDKRALNI